MGAVEDVLVAAAARHRCDFAAVEADADVAEQLGLRGRGRFSDRAAEVEPCTETGNASLPGWNKEHPDKPPTEALAPRDQQEPQLKRYL